MNANQILNELKDEGFGTVSPRRLVEDYETKSSRKHHMYAKITAKFISLSKRGRVEILFHKTSLSFSFKFGHRS